MMETQLLEMGVVLPDIKKEDGNVYPEIQATDTKTTDHG